MSANLTYPQFFERLRQIKSKKGLTFADLAQQLGRDELFVAAMYVAHALTQLLRTGKAGGGRWESGYVGHHATSLAHSVLRAGHRSNEYRCARAS
mgnify:CR=1 FL=1